MLLKFLRVSSLEQTENVEARPCVKWSPTRGLKQRKIINPHQGQIWGWAQGVPAPLLWFIKHFSFTCSIWNLKILPEENAPQTAQKSVPFAVLMGTIAPILPLYTISICLLYPLSTPAHHKSCHNHFHKVVD